MSEDNPARRNLARGGIIGFVGAAASAALGFAYTIVLARMLGAEGAGIVTQATGVFAVVMALSKLGLDSTAIYLVPRLKVDAPERIRATLMFMSALAAAVSLGTVLILEIAAPTIWNGDDPAVREAIRAVLWLVPVGAVGVILAGALRALGSMREYVLVQNIALPFLRLLLVTVAIALGVATSQVALAWAIPFILVLLATLALIRTHLEHSEGARMLASDERRRVLSFTLPRALSAGLEQGLTWFDILLVGWLSGNASAGVYGSASRFIQAGLIVDVALRVVVSPRFSQLLHQQRMGELRSLYSTATIWLILFGTPVHVLMAVFAPALMRVLGPEFADGAGVVVVLAAGTAVTFIAGNIHSLLIMSGRSGWAALNKALVLVGNIVGNITFIPRFGIMGAAVTWAVSMVVDAVLAQVEVVVFLDVRASVRDVVGPLGVVAGAALVPALVVAALLGRDSFIGMGVGTGTAIVCFVIACVVFRGRLHLSGLGSLVSKRREGVERH